MIEVKLVRCGQVRPYADSVTEYAIKSDEPTEQVKAYCLTLTKCRNEKPGYHHNGSCGFPFGLDSFYTFTELGNGEFRFEVTTPYDD